MPLEFLFLSPPVRDAPSVRRESGRCRSPRRSLATQFLELQRQLGNRAVARAVAGPGQWNSYHRIRRRRNGQVQRL